MQEVIPEEERFRSFFNIDKIYHFRDLRNMRPGLYRKLLAFLKDVRPIFKTFVILNPEDRKGTFWGDYSNEYLIFARLISLEELYGDIQVKISGDGKVLSEPLEFNFPELIVSEKLKLIDALNKHFPKKYKWNGSNNQQIFLFGTYTPINSTKLRDSDKYPCLTIEADYKSGDAWRALQEMKQSALSQFPEAVISFSDNGSDVLFKIADFTLESESENEKINDLIGSIKKIMAGSTFSRIVIKYCISADNQKDY